MSELLTSEDFDDAKKIRSEKALRRWRSACSDLKNRRRVLRKLDDLDEHLELQVSYSFYLFIFELLVNLWFKLIWVSFFFFLILSNFAFTYLGLCLISLGLMPNGKFLKLTLRNLNAE